MGDGRRRSRRRARNSGWLVGWYGRFVRRTGERRERSHSQSSPLIFFLFLLRQRRQTRKEKKFPSKSRARPTTGHYPQKSEAPKTLFFWFFLHRGVQQNCLCVSERGGIFSSNLSSFLQFLFTKSSCVIRKKVHYST